MLASLHSPHFEIGEQIQRGLSTAANTHFRFARFEGALSDWRRQLEAGSCAASPPRTSALAASQ